MNKWHSQITSLTVRMYEEGTSYEDKDKYVCVVQVELLGDNSAYLHAALKADASEISFKEWLSLFYLLYREYGITLIKFERRNSVVEIDINRFLNKEKKENYGSNP